MIILKYAKNNEEAHIVIRETVIGATSSRVARVGPAKQRPEREARSMPCQQPGKGTPSKGSEVEGEVSLLKEPQWLPGLRAQGGGGGVG